MSITLQKLTAEFNNIAKLSHVGMNDYSLLNKLKLFHKMLDSNEKEDLSPELSRLLYKIKGLNKSTKLEFKNHIKTKIDSIVQEIFDSSLYHYTQDFERSLERFPAEDLKDLDAFFWVLNVIQEKDFNPEDAIPNFDPRHKNVIKAAVEKLIDVYQNDSDCVFPEFATLKKKALRDMAAIKLKFLSEHSKHQCQFVENSKRINQKQIVSATSSQKKKKEAVPTDEEIVQILPANCSLNKMKLIIKFFHERGYEFSDFKKINKDLRRLIIQHFGTPSEYAESGVVGDGPMCELICSQGISLDIFFSNPDKVIIILTKIDFLLPLCTPPIDMPISLLLEKSISFIKRILNRNFDVNFLIKIKNELKAKGIDYIYKYLFALPDHFIFNRFFRIGVIDHLIKLKEIEATTYFDEFINISNDTKENLLLHCTYLTKYIKEELLHLVIECFSNNYIKPSTNLLAYFSQFKDFDKLNDKHKNILFCKNNIKFTFELVSCGVSFEAVIEFLSEAKCDKIENIHFILKALELKISPKMIATNLKALINVDKFHFMHLMKLARGTSDERFQQVINISAGNINELIFKLDPERISLNEALHLDLGIINQMRIGNKNILKLLDRVNFEQLTTICKHYYHIEMFLFLGMPESAIFTLDAKVWDILAENQGNVVYELTMGTKWEEIIKPYLPQKNSKKRSREELPEE